MNLDAVIQIWDRVRTSLWFVPGLMTIAAIALGITVPAIDLAVADEWVRKVPIVFSGQPSGARAVLATIATSMITIGGVVFSMTIVSLQLASSQFGPRLLRTFLADRGSQLTLGTFVSTFVYCIIVLPTIDATDDAIFVPHLSVSLAVLAALLNLGMLVYFIDHLAQSIHADAVIRAVGKELDGAIDELYSQDADDGEADVVHDDHPAIGLSSEPALVDNASAGYLRFVNEETLITLASRHDLHVRLEAEPGQFVFEGDALATVWPAASVNDELVEQMRCAFALGAHRTTLQDALFGFEQLTEMAVRALSPGINDPTTALHCIDRIGSSLLRVVSRPQPSPVRRDDEGVPRLVVATVPFERLLRLVLLPLARNAEHHLPVWLRLQLILGKTHQAARRADDRERLRALGQRLSEEARSRFDHEDDRQRLDDAAAWAT